MKIFPTGLNPLMDAVYLNEKNSRPVCTMIKFSIYLWNKNKTQIESQPSSNCDHDSTNKNAIKLEGYKASILMRGFTLLELLVAIAIAVILMTIGVPSFNSFIRDSTLRSETNTLSSSLSLSRSEAIRRGENVNITALSGSTDWSQGWRIWIDSNNNNIFDDNDVLIRVFDQVTSNISASQASVSFIHDGSLSLPANQSSIGFDIKPAQNCQTNEQRHLTIEGSGHVDFSLTTCS